MHEQMLHGCCQDLRWHGERLGARGSTFAVQGQMGFGEVLWRWFWPSYYLAMFLFMALLGQTGILVRVVATCPFSMVRSKKRS